MMQAPDGDIRPEDGLVPESSSAPLPSQSSAHSMHVSFLQDFTVRTLLSDSISLIPQLRSCQPSSAHLCVSEKGKALPYNTMRHVSLSGPPLSGQSLQSLADETLQMVC